MTPSHMRQGLAYSWKMQDYYTSLGWVEEEEEPWLSVTSCMVCRSQIRLLDSPPHRWGWLVTTVLKDQYFSAPQSACPAHGGD